MSEDVCRLCCNSNVTLIDIFDNSFDNEICSKIAVCCGIVISREDKITKKVCKQCFFLINSCSELRRIAITNEIRLKSEYDEKQKNAERVKKEEAKENIAATVLPTVDVPQASSSNAIPSIVPSTVSHSVAIQTPLQTPVNTVAQIPTQTSVQTSVQAPTQTTTQTPTQISRKASVEETTVQTSMEIPVQPTQTPAQKSVQPVQTPVQTSAQTSTHTLVQASVSVAPKQPAPSDVSQDSFMSSLKLTKIGFSNPKSSRKKYLRYHPSVSKLKMLYPGISIPSVCHQWDLGAFVKVDWLSAGNWASPAKMDVWTINNKKHNRLYLRRIKGKRNTDSSRESETDFLEEEILNFETGSPKSDKSSKHSDVSFCPSSHESDSGSEISVMKPVSQSKARNEPRIIVTRLKVSADKRKSSDSADAPNKKSKTKAKVVARKQDEENLEEKEKLQVLASLIEHDTSLSESNKLEEDNCNSEDNNLLVETSYVSKTFICQTCSKVFDTNRALKDHQKQHLKNSLRCFKCSYSFPIVEDLIKHNLQEHSSESVEEERTKLNFILAKNKSDDVGSENPESDALAFSEPDTSMSPAPADVTQEPVSSTVEETVTSTTSVVNNNTPKPSRQLAKKSTCQVKPDSKLVISNVESVSRVKSPELTPIITNVVSQAPEDPLITDVENEITEIEDDDDACIIVDKVEEYVISSDEDIEIVGITKDDTAAENTRKRARAFRNRRKNKSLNQSSTAANNSETSVIVNNDVEASKSIDQEAQSQNPAEKEASTNILRDTLETSGKTAQSTVVLSTDKNETTLVTSDHSTDTPAETSKGKEMMPVTIADEDFYLKYVFNKNIKARKEKLLSSRTYKKSTSSKIWELKNMAKLLEKSFIPVEFIKSTEEGLQLRYTFSGNRRPKPKNTNHRWSVLGAVDIPKIDAPRPKTSYANSVLTQSGQVYDIPKNMEIVSVSSKPNEVTNTHSVIVKPSSTQNCNYILPTTNTVVSSSSSFMLPGAPVSDQDTSTGVKTSDKIIPLQNGKGPLEQFIAKVLPNGVLELTPTGLQAAAKNSLIPNMTTSGNVIVPVQTKNVSQKPGNVVMPTLQNPIHPIKDLELLHQAPFVINTPTATTPKEPSNLALMYQQFGQQTSVSIQNFLSINVPPVTNTSVSNLVLDKPAGQFIQSSINQAGQALQSSILKVQSRVSERPVITETTESPSTTGAKPLLRIKNISELTEKATPSSTKTNDRFSLQNMYVQTLNNYVNSCAKGPLSTVQSNGDEYLQIS